MAVRSENENMNELLDLLKSKKLNPAEGEHHFETWEFLGEFLQEKPIMTNTELEEMGSLGAVLLRFGASKIEKDEALTATPLQRNLGHKEPLNTMVDYIGLAVARQLTLLMPHAVSGIHSFEQLYGGRLLTELWTCFRRGPGYP